MAALYSYNIPRIGKPAFKRDENGDSALGFTAIFRHGRLHELLGFASGFSGVPRTTRTRRGQDPVRIVSGLPYRSGSARETRFNAVHTYRVYEQASACSLVIPGVSRYPCAFNDLNDDFQFQDDEPHAWLACRKALAPVDDVTCSRAAKGATRTTRTSKYASVMVAAPFWNKCSIEQQSTNNADAEHPPKTKRNPLKK